MPKSTPKEPAVRLALPRPDVATAIGVSLRTLDRLIATGEFPPADIVRGRKLRLWKISTIEAGLEQLSTQNA